MHPGHTQWGGRLILSLEDAGFDQHSGGKHVRCVFMVIYQAITTKGKCWNIPGLPLQAYCLYFGMLQSGLCPVLTPPCTEHQQVTTQRGRGAVTKCIPKIHAVERALEQVRSLSRTKARREFLGQRAGSVRMGQEPPAHAYLQLLAPLSHPPKPA